MHKEKDPQLSAVMRAVVARYPKGNQLESAMIKKDTAINVNLDIPDKQPFEGEATQKQKQRLWELGWRDEAMIASLGKKQAGALLDQLMGVWKKEAKLQESVRAAWTFIYLVLGAIALFVIFAMFQK
jgi:hypothetical protein